VGRHSHWSHLMNLNSDVLVDMFPFATKQRGLFIVLGIMLLCLLVDKAVFKQLSSGHVNKPQDHEPNCSYCLWISFLMSKWLFPCAIITFHTYYFLVFLVFDSHNILVGPFHYEGIY